MHTERIAERVTRVSTMAVGPGVIALHGESSGIIVLDEQLDTVRVVPLPYERTPIEVCSVTREHVIVSGRQWRTVGVATGEIVSRAAGDARSAAPVGHLFWAARPSEVVVHDDRDLSVLARFSHEWLEDADLVLHPRGDACFVDVITEQAGRAASLLLRLEGREIRGVVHEAEAEGALVSGWLDERRVVGTDEGSLFVLDAREGRVLERVSLPGVEAATALSTDVVLAQGFRGALWRVDLSRAGVEPVELDGGAPEGSIRKLYVLDSQRFVTLWSGEARDEVLRVDAFEAA